MSEQEPATELVLAHTGELVNLEDVSQVGAAFKEVAEIRRKLIEADRLLRDALAEHAKIQGTKTIYIEHVGKFEVKGGEITDWVDPLALADALRSAGMPESVVNEIVVEKVDYKVDGRRAARAAKANPEYAEIIERSKRIIERTPTISIT
jgi:hypothetical protein